MRRNAAVILGSVGTPQDIEEVASDVFVAAWHRSAEFDPRRATLRGWLLMLTKYSALQRRRRLLGQRFAADGGARLVPLASVAEPADSVSPEEEALRAADRATLRTQAARGRRPGIAGPALLPG